jgi:D-alanyl-D-alanine carboxypeptidase
MAPDLYMRIGQHHQETFTVTAILMLADQGKLGLDVPIDRYVEGLPSGKQITLCLSARVSSRPNSRWGRRPRRGRCYPSVR